MSSVRQPRQEVDIPVLDGGRKPRSTYHPYEYSSDMYYKEEMNDKKSLKYIERFMSFREISAEEKHIATQFLNVIALERKMQQKAF